MPRNTRDWITVLWPAFVGACLLEIVVFAAFDPHDVHVFGLSIEADRDTVYSLAFFAFWTVTAATGLVTWSLSRPTGEIEGGQARRPDPPPSAPPGAA